VLVWEYESSRHYPRTCLSKLPKHNLSALVKTIHNANPSNVVAKLGTIKSRADLLQTLQSHSYDFFEYASESADITYEWELKFQRNNVLESKNDFYSGKYEVLDSKTVKLNFNSKG